MDASKFFFVCLICFGGVVIQFMPGKQIIIQHFQAKSDKTQQINVSHY